MKRLVAAVLLVLGGTAAASCAEEHESEPLVCSSAGIDASCTTTYPLTYDALYPAIFQPTCAKSGASCHASDGRQRGLDFDDREASYAQLHANYIHPGDPTCSRMVLGVVSSDPFVRMPPGASLGANEQCAIIQWVVAGAPR